MARNSSLCGAARAGGEGGAPQNTSTVSLENYNDTKAVEEILAGIMNGSVTLPPVDNSTNVQDTICRTDTTVALIPNPLATLNDNNSTTGPPTTAGLEKKYVIVIAVLGGVLLLFIVGVLIYRRKAVVLTTTMALAGASAKSKSKSGAGSSVVMDASGIPVPPSGAGGGAGGCSQPVVLNK